MVHRLHSDLSKHSKMSFLFSSPGSYLGPCILFSYLTASGSFNLETLQSFPVTHALHSIGQPSLGSVQCFLHDWTQAMIWALLGVSQQETRDDDPSYSWWCLPWSRRGRPGVSTVKLSCAFVFDHCGVYCYANILFLLKILPMNPGFMGESHLHPPLPWMLNDSDLFHRF